MSRNKHHGSNRNRKKPKPSHKSFTGKKSQQSMAQRLAFRWNYLNVYFENPTQQKALAGVNISIFVIIFTIGLMSATWIKADNPDHPFFDIIGLIPSAILAGIALLGQLIAKQTPEDYFKTIVKNTARLTWSIFLILALLSELLAIKIAVSKITDPCANQKGPRANVAEHEILVLLAPFAGSENLSDKPEDIWALSLPHEMEKAVLEENLRFYKLPNTIANYDQAVVISGCYQATMVIWGAIAGAAMEVNYTITQRWSFADPIGQSYLAPEFDGLHKFVNTYGDNIYAVNFLLGQLYVFDGDYPKALEFLTTAITNAPIEPEDRRIALNVDVAYNLLGVTYTQLRQLEPALEAYNNAIALNSENMIYYNGRGSTLYLLGQDLDAALADFNRGLELDPNQPSLYSNRAMVYLEQKEYDLALQDANKAVDLNPKFDMAYHARGLALTGIGQYDLALKDFTMAVKLAPNEMLHRFNRAILFAQLGNYKEAMSDFDKAISLDPTSAKSYLAYGTFLFEVHGNEIGVQMLEKYLELEPNPDPSALEMLESMRANPGNG